MVYTDPALWEEAKRAARERLGGHSARAMQLAGQLYRAAGGRYVGRKTKAQRSLATWTGQDWTTKSGKSSRETGERYLPRRVIEQLTSAEYAATTRAKRQGTKQGKQFVKQPAKIAAKVSRLKMQHNPRPRKYASAAEKQAAFRARFPTLCVRVEPKTADTVQAVADASGRTQQETLLSMLKYAMTNRNWITLGLTEHKQLPRIEEPRKANPMKRKPTPAQIAARERFAAMARSGAFKKKAAKARKKNPLTYGLDGVVNITDTYERSVASSRNLAEHYANQLRMRGRDNIVYVVFGITPEAKAQAGRYRNGVTITLEPRDYEIAYAFHPTQGEISRQLKAQRDAERRAFTRQGMKLKSNPSKKTVSQKISQLTREGYPQKQAIAIALSEERAGKVKRNPTKRANPMVKYALVPDDGGFTYGMDDRTPVQFVFSNRDRVRGIYRSFALPKSVTSNLEFQRWASSLPGNSVIASLNDLRKMLKQYT